MGMVWDYAMLCYKAIYAFNRFRLYIDLHFTLKKIYISIKTILLFNCHELSLRLESSLGRQNLLFYCFISKSLTAEYNSFYHDYGGAEANFCCAGLL